MKVSCEKLTVKRGERLVLRDLSVVFEGPGLYQVVGPNGVGKTTLLLTIIGVVKPISGRVLVEPAGAVSYMPQSFELPVDAPISVFEFVENYLKLWSKRRSSKVDVESRVREVLELVGVPSSLWHEKLSRLSGGMVRRTLLARALSPDTPIVLLDEPFSGVDPEGKVDIADILGSLSKNKLVILTNHDPILLLDYTKKLLLLGYEFYSYGVPDEVLKYEVLSKFYKRCAIEIEKHVHVVDWH